MASIPHSAVQEQAPIDIGAAVAYADQHGSQAAADYYRVNPRTIRKWRARIERRQHEAASANVRPVAATESVKPTTSASPNHTPSQASTPDHALRAFRGIARGMTARNETMWLCPHCRELHHPLPGQGATEWNEYGCYLCSSKRQRSASLAALGPVQNDTPSPTALGPGRTDMALPSGEASSGPPQADSPAAPAPPPARHNQETPAQSTMRAHLERAEPQGPLSVAAGALTLASRLSAWAGRYPGARNQMIALATVIALIYLCSV